MRQPVLVEAEAQKQRRTRGGCGSAEFLGLRDVFNSCTVRLVAGRKLLTDSPVSAAVNDQAGLGFGPLPFGLGGPTVTVVPGSSTIANWAAKLPEFAGCPSFEARFCRCEHRVSFILQPGAYQIQWIYTHDWIISSSRIVAPQPSSMKRVMQPIFDAIWLSEADSVPC